MTKLLKGLKPSDKLHPRVLKDLATELLPRLGKESLFFLLSITRNYVFSSRRGFLFLLVLRMGCVNLLWHSVCLPYNYLRPIFVNLFQKSNDTDEIPRERVVVRKMVLNQIGLLLFQASQMILFSAHCLSRCSSITSHQVLK